MNKVILIGRLVADPELRYTPSNVAVTSIRLAVDRPYSKGSERQADFIDVTCWRQTAEFVCRYFHKGNPIIVEGRLQVNQYTDRNTNEKRTRYDVQADNVSFVPGSKNSDTRGGDPYDQTAPSYTAAPAAPASAPAYSSGNAGDFQEIEGEDDLPF